MPDTHKALLAWISILAFATLPGWARETRGAADNRTPGSPGEIEDSGSAGPLSHDEDEWRIEVTPWIWLVGLHGDAGARGLEASIDASFIDILDESDSVFAFSGRLEISKGRVGGFVEGTYAKLGVDDASGRFGLTAVDITSELGLVDLGVLLRVNEWAAPWMPEQSGHAVTLDVYSGARIMTLDLELDPARLAARSQSKTWVDPFVGARARAPLGESTHLAVSGDLGGFGISSDITWSASAMLGHTFELGNHAATLYGGYKAVGHDYTDGSGPNRFRWNVVMHGPIFGLTIAF